MVITGYLYPDVSGVGKHTYNLCKRLVANYDYQVSVVTSGTRYAEENISGIKIYRLPYWFKLSNTPINLQWYGQLRKLVSKENPDVINSRAPVPYLPDLGALACGRIPFVLGYHFPSMLKGDLFPDALIKFYESFILKYMLNKARKIICSSDFVRLNFLKDYQHKSITITQGVDTELFQPSKRWVLNQVLFVGNFWVDYKGLSYLIKAIGLVRTAIKDVRLVVVGSGNFKYYRNLCRKYGVDGQVIFRGTLGGTELVRAYQESHLVVQPSINDNFPSVILEAMACAKPVIGTQVGAIPEMIDDQVTGLLVPAKDEKALADAMVTILKQRKLCERLAINGYRRTKDNFNWDEQTQKTHQVITSVLYGI